ncbi:MAG: SGNH/GDSL hydrolase family protein [bacterium]
MKVNKDSSLLFIGDSITDCGRDRPVGKRRGLGDGYVNLIDSLLEAICPEKRITVLNTGISGNRVIDLDARWNEDVIKLNPDWVSIMIGINDVWRQFDTPEAPVQVNKTMYKEVYSGLIESIIKKVNGLVLMTPYLIEKDRSDPMRKIMDEYGEIVRDLADNYKTLFVDVQEGFDKYLEFNPSQNLCADRIHPYLAGHVIIAKGFLKTIDFEWN